MEVFCLRVGKTTAGKKFPFDRVYLVNYDNRAVIDKMFRYALVLPVEDALKKMLCEIEPDEYINRTFHRDDAENTKTTIDNGDWIDLIKDGEWVMVVPILSKWMNQNMPRYLVAEHWFDARTARTKKGRVILPSRPSPFTNRSYLQTPHRKIRPICVVCPRMILHQNGECQLGEKICYETLPLGLVNHFDEGGVIPGAPPNMLEPEEHELREGEALFVEPPAQSKTKDLLRIIHE